jgi:hypothetical protein
MPSWIRRSKIRRGLERCLLVTLYARTNNDQLIVSSFSGRKVQDEKSMVSFPHFLSLAWTAANEKAKEIGWMVSGRFH